MKLSGINNSIVESIIIHEMRNHSNSKFQNPIPNYRDQIPKLQALIINYSLIRFLLSLNSLFLPLVFGSWNLAFGSFPIALFPYFPYFLILAFIPLSLPLISKQRQILHHLYHFVSGFCNYIFVGNI
jgi:hypothetical protein